MKDFMFVIAKRKTYKNLLFVLTTFLLSNFYFIFFTTGFSLSFGLSFIIIGVPLFVLFLFAARSAGSLDIVVMNYLLDAGITDVQSRQSVNFWESVRSVIADDITWKRLVYIFVKYPIDILLFTVTTTMIGSSLGMILVPILHTFDIFIFNLPGWIYYNLSTPVIVFLGIFLLIASFHVLNLLTSAYQQAASYFLTVTPKRYAVDLIQNA